jgi:hypothetical protein
LRTSWGLEKSADESTCHGNATNDEESNADWYNKSWDCFVRTVLVDAFAI